MEELTVSKNWLAQEISIYMRKHIDMIDNIGGKTTWFRLLTSRNDWEKIEKRVRKAKRMNTLRLMLSFIFSNNSGKPFLTFFFHSAARMSMSSYSNEFDSSMLLLHTEEWALNSWHFHHHLQRQQQKQPLISSKRELKCFAHMIFGHNKRHYHI